jgi:electron transfer flavoprotein beta subunit
VFSDGHGPQRFHNWRIIVSYSCVVCIKQVPDTRVVGENVIGAESSRDRKSVGVTVNPDDLRALEAALMVRDQYGGTVTAITMGPPEASEVLREALYRGADRSFLITDSAAAGSDTFATSYILACAIKKLNPDFVLCGGRSIDGETGQTGPQLAEKLKLTLITYMAEPVELEGRTVTVRRHLENGSELVKADLPVLITVLGMANTPRPPALKRVMKLKKARSRVEVELDIAAGMPDATDKKKMAETNRKCKKLEKAGLLIGSWNLEDIDANPARCGIEGSPTRVLRVQSITVSAGEYKEFENSEKGIGAFISDLFDERVEGESRGKR